jgi:hypothetical protein
MIDFDVIAYTMLGISSSVSALQIGRWLLNANQDQGVYRPLADTGDGAVAGYRPRQSIAQRPLRNG